MKKLILASLPLLWFLVMACSSELPTPVPDGSVNSPTHRSLTIEQAHQRLNSMWAQLPHTSTRAEADADPIPDSAFNVPTGEFVGTFDPGTEAWVIPDGAASVDTIANYAYAMTFKGGGFAIMSSTDYLPDLLFYSEDGSFDSNSLSKSHLSENGFGIFLDYLSDCYTISVSAYPEGGGGSSTTVTDWVRTVKIAGNGIPVKWNQDKPYNRYCSEPYNPDIPTGCMATAVAQLMAFHQYPSTYKGYSFDWSEMIKKSDNDGVSRLMYFVGLPENLAMKYDINGSSAFFQPAVRTFKNFGYGQWGKNVHFDYDALKKEIEAGYPVLMSGYDKATKGHAWVADAYFNIYRTKKYSNGKQEKESYDYIRCNWGWGGRFNGYAIAGVFNYHNTFQDPDSFIPTRGGDDCDILCGGYYPEFDADKAYCRNVHMIYGIRVK